MNNTELTQLELLSAIDDLRDRVVGWVQVPSPWEPVKRCQSLLKLILERVETLRIRLEAPLVVASFGGTGTGKSSLVNALIGEECTLSGRQRPTTRKPVLITHSQTELSVLGIPLDAVEVVKRDAEILRDIIILDCPDPDTNESGTPDSNLDRLRALLPYCDVLLYISTQQKYRSARVADELRAAAAGCRMIFVQTHADLDSDIRDDWKKTLGNEFDVPEVFFVDSLRALKEQQAGQKPTGDMGRLIDLLTTQLGASSRVQIRRANVVDLLQAGLTRCQQILEAQRPAVLKLQTALADQRGGLGQRMASHLKTELLSGRSLWERRLLSAVTDQWGASPFSSVLRMYNGIGAIIASMTLFRARSTAQIALLGTIQGVRWLESKRKEQEAESSLNRVSQFGLDDALLREAEIVIEGHVSSARFSSDLLKDRTLDDLRRQAVVVENQFVGSAGQHVEEIITDLSVKNSKWWIRAWYEFLFISLIAFILYRVGKNFFFESFVQEKDLLSSDFYLAAGLFLALWSAVLVISFTKRLRRGLVQRVNQLANKMVESKLSVGLFPGLESAARHATRDCDEISRMLNQTTELRHQIAGSSTLGAKRESPNLLVTKQ